MFPTIHQSGKGKTTESVKKNQWLPGIWVEGRMNRFSTEDFKVPETILYDTTIVDTHTFCIFLQNHKMGTKSEF